MKKKWILKSIFIENKFILLQKKLKFSTYLMQLILQRKINNFLKIKKYFKPTLDDLHDPFLMLDMDKAVIRFIKAIKNKENILVFGDYDVDGITAVSMMYSFIQEFYPNVEFYIPDRFSEGYGISIQGIKYAYKKKINLIIALDCGITSINEIQFSNLLNIDIIICDHHLPGENIPNAAAILNPLRNNCNYPFKYLSGCGVGFKLIQGISNKLSIKKEILYSYLDLVAISIASDLVDITGENRILAKFGSEKLVNNPRLGLKLLLSETKSSLYNIMNNIVYSIAPKLNVSGRLKHASESVKLLITKNSNIGNILFNSIIKLNEKRKLLQSKILEEAIIQIKSSFQDEKDIIIVYNKFWNKGVLGIIASQLVEIYHKPALVFTKNGNEWIGSGRSIKNFDIYTSLSSYINLFNKFGGHKFAVGLSIKEDQFIIFKKKYELSIEKENKIKYTRPILEIDLELSLNIINPKFIRMMSYMAPFGRGNPLPVFLSKNLIYANKYSKLIGKEKKHIMISISEKKSNIIFKAIGFNMAFLIEKFEKKSFDMVYSINENIWKSSTYYNLIIHDVKFYI